MATRAKQFDFLIGPFWDGDGTQIDTPYAKFYAAGTSTAKDAYADKDKSVSFTKKALATEGNTIFGDGVYKVEVYSGDPDAGGTKAWEVDNFKCVAVLGNTRTVTSDTTATVDDILILADTSSGNINVTLYDAALGAGRQVVIQKVSADNTVTVTAPSGQTIDNAASVSFTGNNAALAPRSDGSNWYGQQAQGDATSLGGVGASGYLRIDGTNPMVNDIYLTGRNAANSANIPIAKINGSDELVTGSAATIWLPSAPIKNNTPLQARNAAGSASVPLARLNTSDEVELGSGTGTTKVVAATDPVARVGGADYTIWTENSDGAGSGLEVDSATQSEQETGTNAVKAVTPSVQQYHPSAAKAWAAFETTGNTLEAAYNVAGVTDNGTGDFTVTIGDDFSSADYHASIVVEDTGATIMGKIVSRAAGTTQVGFFKLDGAAIDPEKFHFAAHGDL